MGIKALGKPRLLALGAAILAAVLIVLWTSPSVGGQGGSTGGLMLVLVVDDSGSMAETDPNQLRGLGARLLIERLFPEDQIAILLFSAKAKVVQPLSPIGDRENREALKESFRNLESSGTTEMLDALSQAFGELEQDSSESPKFVVFLTDGKLELPEEDSPEYHAALEDLLRSYRDKEWPIFPISFGRDVDVKFLEHIASVTGGETCDAASDEELVPCFQRVLDTFKEVEQAVEALPGCLAEGESLDHPVYVDPYARQFSIVLGREGSSLQVMLRDPQGALQGPPPEEENTLFYNFQDPAPGVWRVGLTGPGCFQEISSFIDSDVQIELGSPAPVHAAGQPMDLRAGIVGRRAAASTAWESLKGDLALSVVSPDGSEVDIPLSRSGLEFVGEYASTTEVGDYQLVFQATLEYEDPDTGELVARTYTRKKHVEVVEAPVLEVAAPGAEVYRILPGDSLEVRGRISPPELAVAAELGAQLGGDRVALDLAPDGSFWGNIRPTRSGRQKLDLSMEMTLTGLYGEVRYPMTRSVAFTVEFERLGLGLTRESPGAGVSAGDPVTLIGRVTGDQGAVDLDQTSLTVKLATPGRKEVPVELTAGDSPGEFRGRFVPRESGRYEPLQLATDPTRNRVQVSLRADGHLDISLRPVLEISLDSIGLGQVYPGATITRQLQVSNPSPLPILLSASTNSEELAVSLPPVEVPPGVERWELPLQFQVHPQAAMGSGAAQTELVWSTTPLAEVRPGPTLPLSYEIGDFFVELESGDYDLGYVRPDNGTVPLHLAVRYSAPVPIRLQTVAQNVAGQSAPTMTNGELESTLPDGSGSETITIMVHLPPDPPAGSHQGSVALSADPPFPIRPSQDVSFTYRLPTELQTWVLDNGRWTLGSSMGASAVLLLLWGWLVARKPTVKGHLLVYDRSGTTRTRRANLRKLSKSRITIGSRGDVSLRDPNGGIEPEHAQIVVTHNVPYPRVYPIDGARVMGPFRQEVDRTGAPLSDGDTFVIGQYNLQWNRSRFTSGFSQVLGDRWWRVGLVLLAGALGAAAVTFYVVIL